MANGEAPSRGSAAAAASLRRRRAGGSSGATAGGANTMLQFYTEGTAAGRQISPNAVLIMSIGFIAVVALLHVFGKLYLAPR